MTYILTGHLGFLGSHLTRELNKRRIPWVGLDIANPHSPDRFDLCIPGVFSRYLETFHSEIKGVIHLAAQPGRVFGAERPEKTISSNTLMTYNVACACGEFGIPLVYFSTSEVYGSACFLGRVDESSVPDPINLYGMTKLWGEQLSDHYAPQLLKIIRPTMPYGPTMPFGYGRAALPTFVSQAMSNKPITVHRDTERSWCYIDDFIDGLMLVLESAEGGCFNVGRDDDLRSMEEVAHAVCRVVGVPPSLIKTEDPDDTITPIKDISTRRLRDMGFEPKVDLEEGIRRTRDAQLQVV